MVDYDVKVFVADTEENREKLASIGLTQIDEYHSIWNNAKNWYVGVEDFYENGVCDVCDVENEACRFYGREEVSEEEFDECNEDNCGVFQKIIVNLESKRALFDELIDGVFPKGAIYIYGCKKDASDQLRSIFKENNFSDALSNLEKWIKKNFDTYLNFGNDDLNGWTLVEWKFKGTKELGELAKKCSEIIA